MLKKMISLNPYSTGSNSNLMRITVSSCNEEVLILILLEVTQIEVIAPSPYFQKLS